MIGILVLSLWGCLLDDDRSSAHDSGDDVSEDAQAERSTACEDACLHQVSDDSCTDSAAYLDECLDICAVTTAAVDAMGSCDAELRAMVDCITGQQWECGPWGQIPSETSGSSPCLAETNALELCFQQGDAPEPGATMVERGYFCDPDSVTFDVVVDDARADGVSVTLANASGAAETHPLARNEDRQFLATLDRGVADPGVGQTRFDCIAEAWVIRFEVRTDGAVSDCEVMDDGGLGLLSEDCVDR